MSAKVIKVTTNDIANGPGIRTVVWFAGCDHHCKGCHNPNTWNPNQGTDLTQELINKIIESCNKSYIAGLTLTGGDPLYVNNLEGVSDLIHQFRDTFNEEKSIWMWTGYKLEQLCDINMNPSRLYDLPLIDVLVDGRYVEKRKNVSLPYAGSDNQRVIDLKKTFNKGEITLWHENLNV